MDESSVPRQIRSPFWVRKMTHTRRNIPVLNFRMVVTHTVYTRHGIAEQVIRLQETDFRSIGTVRMNNIEDLNRLTVHAAAVNLK